MVENPSAGKFDPPPGTQERFEPPRPARRGARIIALLGLAYVAVDVLRHWWHPIEAWTGGALLVTLALLQWMARRKFQPDDDQPYSDAQHVTR